MVKKLLGEIDNFYAHVNAAAIKLKAPLKVGDKISIEHGNLNFEQTIESMQINRKPVKSAKKGDETGILVNQAVKKGYKVYKI